MGSSCASAGCADGCGGRPTRTGGPAGAWKPATARPDFPPPSLDPVARPRPSDRGHRVPTPAGPDCALSAIESSVPRGGCGRLLAVQDDPSDERCARSNYVPLKSHCSHQTTCVMAASEGNAPHPCGYRRHRTKLCSDKKKQQDCQSNARKSATTSRLTFLLGYVRVEQIGAKYA